jgi:dTDP-4-dehydrorhamnose reductase
MKKKVLVTGATGFVGKNLLKNLSNEFKTFGTYYSKRKEHHIFLDITDAKSVSKVFDKIKPEIVIHTAALPNVNFCETNKPLAKMINLTGSKNIINACKSQGAKLIFISTDYVFDGREGPYSEEAETNPLNLYGKLKLETELEIKHFLNDYLIIRTTNVYGYDLESKNFVMFVLETLKEGKEVIVANDQYGNPTYVKDLSKAIMELILKRKVGVYNVAGPDNINRVEFARIIADVWGCDPGLVIGKKTEELKQTALRPKRSGFVIDKIKNELETKMNSTKEGLKLMRDVSLTIQ